MPSVPPADLTDLDRTRVEAAGRCLGASLCDFKAASLIVETAGRNWTSPTGKDTLRACYTLAKSLLPLIEQLDAAIGAVLKPERGGEHH